MITISKQWVQHSIGIHVRLHHANTTIAWLIAVCNVQSGLETLQRQYSSVGHYSGVAKQYSTREVGHVY